MNYFEELNQINVNDKTKKKNKLTYLSWAYAWGELKNKYPDANYKVYEREDGCNYFTDGRTCWVKVSVTVPAHVEYEAHKDSICVAEIEHTVYLPVMDNRNNSIQLEKVTSMDVNKAIQRALTKAIALHGIGLYIYAGEDLPETSYICENCKRDIQSAQGMTPEQIAAGTYKTYQKCLCMVCAGEAKKHRLAQQALIEQKEIPVEVIEG